MSSEPDPSRPLWGPARRVTAPVPPAAEDQPAQDPFGDTAATPPARLPAAQPPWRPSAPPPPPQPSPPASPSPARTGRIGPAVLIGAVVVAVLVIGGIAWSTSRSTTAAPTGQAVATSIYAPPTPTNDPSPPTTATSLASPDGLVVVTPDAASSPNASTVVALLDRYFTAINNRDYATWSSTVDARRAAAQPYDAWVRAYESTQDRSVEVSSITSAGSDQLALTLSFVSTQSTSDAPSDLQVPQICWQSTWPLTDVSSGGRIAAPAKGATTKSAC